MRAPKLLFLIAALAGALPATAAGTLFCCIDERGKQACGDILPVACYGRAYREISASGLTVRNVEAPLTAEQKALRAAEDRKRKEEEAALREQRRMDQALLQTYGSLDDVELMRKRAEADVMASIAAAEKKIADARQVRKKFEDEAEFYKKKTLPPDVEKGLKLADFEIGAQQNLIDVKKKELGTIKAKYDEDRRRYLELTRSRTATTQALPVPGQTAAPAGKP